MLGGTGSGKTAVLHELLYQRRQFRQILLITGSKDLRERFNRHFPDSLIWDDWHEDDMKRILDCQENDKAIGKGTELLIMLDDFGYKKNQLRKSAQFKRILMNGATHCNTLLMCCFQDTKAIEPDLRGQFHIIILLGEPNRSTRKRIFDCFQCGFETFNQFDRCMKELTQKHGIMVFSRRAGVSYNPLKCVFKYRLKNKHIFDPKRGQEGRRFLCGDAHMQERTLIELEERERYLDALRRKYEKEMKRR